MAKLPRTGVAYKCLYEQEHSLSEVMASLGLKPLSKKAERSLRERLGFALGKWEEPCAGVEVDDVARSLTSNAKTLEKIARLAAVAKGGMNLSEEIEGACRLAEALSEDSTIGSVAAAQVYLADFGGRATIIASACRSAAKKLRLIRGKGGGTPHLWYDEFAAVLLDICKANKLQPSVRIDRGSGEPVGDLAKVAAGFEVLLPPRMRSPTPEAMVKRLQRSSSRLVRR
jgi:hypothetical protein